MGVLANFIVANEGEAAAYDGDTSIPDSHCAYYKTFTEIELGTLYHITQGKKVDDDTLYDFKVIREVDGGERVTIELLSDLDSLSFGRRRRSPCVGRIVGANREDPVRGRRDAPGAQRSTPAVEARADGSQVRLPLELCLGRWAKMVAGSALI